MYLTMKEWLLPLQNKMARSCQFVCHVMTQMMRLHQITCGHFKADDGTFYTIANNRLTALMELFEETEGKVIIWANYEKT